MWALLLLCTVCFADKVLVLPAGPPQDPAYYHPQAEVIDLDYFGPAFRKEKFWLFKLLSNDKLKIPLDPQVKKIVCMNIPNHFFRDYKVRSLPKEKMVLFMWEPRIRTRKLYNQNLHSCFSKIYTWDDNLVDNTHYFKFYYPVLRPMIQEVVPFEEKKLCVLVTGYVNNPIKYPGKHPDELYTHRFKAAQFFEKLDESGFDVYGRGWEKAPPLRSYKGPCQDKLAVIKNYKFSLCYENCQGASGYITEKIFDCFAAGTVPIYWGAPNICDYIPKECFIDKRDFATLDELYLHLTSMTQERYEAYLQAIRTYLKSEAAQLFSHDHFKKILQEI
jgi:hypothetical protein